MAATPGSPPVGSYAPAAAAPPGAATPPGSATRAYEAYEAALQSFLAQQQAATTSQSPPPQSYQTTTPAALSELPDAIYKATPVDARGIAVGTPHYVVKPPVGWDTMQLWNGFRWDRVDTKDLPPETVIAPQDVSHALMQGYLADKAQERATQTVLSGLEKYKAPGGGYYLDTALQEGVSEAALYAAGFPQKTIDAAQGRVAVAVAPVSQPVAIISQPAILSQPEWEAQIKAGGVVSGDLSGMYKEYVKANERTVGIVQIGTVTSDVLGKFPGAKVGDKFAVTDSGQEILVAPETELTDKFNKLSIDYSTQALQTARLRQEAYDKWAATKTPQQLSEIQSGRFQVYDYDSGRMVPVTEKEYNDREALYAQYPEAGTSPGQITLPQAITNRFAKQAANLPPEDANTVLATLNSKGLEAAMSQYNQVVDRQRVAFEQNLKSMPKAFQDAYATKGIEGYNAVVSRTSAVLQTMSDMGFKDASGNYDLVRAVGEVGRPGTFTKSELGMVFGRGEVDKATKLAAVQAVYHPSGPSLVSSEQAHLAGLFTSPVIVKPGSYVTDAEYAALVKPDNVSATEYAKVAPFIGKGGVDVSGAIGAKVPDNLIKQVSGLDDKGLADAKWLQDYQSTNFARQQGMAAIKDPVAYAAGIGSVLGNMAMYAVPILGTQKLREEDAPDWQIALSTASDALIVLTEVKAISAAIKGGAGIGEAMGRSALNVARGIVVSPYTLARHPVQTIKSLVEPFELLLKPTQVPMATVWRGTYDDGFAIAKVLAGNDAEALATRAAMEEQFRRITSGAATSGKVDIPGFGELKFSATGLQEAVPNVTFTATPFYKEFAGGVGVGVKGEGLFTSSQALHGLEAASASGKSPTYVIRGKEIIGQLDDTGKLVNDSGKDMGGALKAGQSLSDIKGKGAFRLLADGSVTDKAGVTVGQLKSGAVWTDNAPLIGKYYAGTREATTLSDGRSVLATVDKGGHLVDDAGAVVGEAAPKVVGFVPEGAKVVGLDGKTIVGTVKSKPTFVMIYTNGVQELPAITKEATTIGQFANKAWSAFKSEENTNDLYPVFKKYAKWIEDEGLIPAGSKLVPVLDKNGKPFMMSARDEFGRMIQIPALQLVTKDWFLRVQEATRVAGIQAAKLQPKMAIVGMLSAVQSLPKAKNVAPYIAEWFRNNGDARLVGSTVEYLYLGKNKPHDIDMGASNPGRAANEIADLIRSHSGEQVRVALNKDGTARIEWLNKKQSLWEEVANVKYPSDKYATTTIEGVRLETPASQLARTVARMEDDFGGKGYARWARFARALGGDIDIGIGAVPPSTSTLRGLQARGIWNTVRDIFVPGLTKERRVQSLAEIAPDLKPAAEQLVTAEDRVNALRRQYTALQGTIRAQGATAPLRASISALRDRLQSAETEYSRVLAGLQDKVYTRALVLSQVDSRIPSSVPDRTVAFSQAVQDAFRSANAPVAAGQEPAVTSTDTTEQAIRAAVARKVSVTPTISRAVSESRVKPTARIDRVAREPVAERGTTQLREAVPPRVETTSRVRAAPERLPTTPELARVPSSERLERPSPERIDSAVRAPVQVTERTPRVTPPERITPREPIPREPRLPLELQRPPRTPDTSIRPPIPPRGPATPPRIPFLGGGTESGVEVTPGTLAWRQGAFYRWIPPPWNQLKPKSSRTPPIGFVERGRTPRETVQIIGKPDSKVPKSVSIDLGVVDIFIEDYGKTIRFKGEGETTIAGESIQSPTMGMSVPATTPRKVRVRARYAVSKKTVSKKTATKRGARYLGGETISLSELTGL